MHKKKDLIFCDAMMKYQVYFYYHKCLKNRKRPTLGWGPIFIIYKLFTKNNSSDNHGENDRFELFLKQ